MNIEQIKGTCSGYSLRFSSGGSPLAKNIILLTLGGNHAQYGKEDSDLDIRGITLNSKQEILLRKDFPDDYGSSYRYSDLFF